MMRMIILRLKTHLENNKIYMNAMSGFCRGRSSIDNKINLITSVECEKCRLYGTTALFLDAKATFGYTEHQAILNALPKLASMYKNLLQDRTINVSTDMGEPTARTLKGGVPHGGEHNVTLFNIRLIGLDKRLRKSLRRSVNDYDIWVRTPSIPQQYVYARQQ